MKVYGYCVLALALMAHAGAARADEVWLIKDGEARGHLFLPPTVGRPLLFASDELREYLRKMTGAALPIAYRGTDVRNKKDVGIWLRVRDREEWEGKESSQAFMIEGTVKPAPAAPFTGVTIVGNTEMAVLFGVYQYLGELGVRWFAPGELGENVPKLEGLAVTAGRRSHRPAFLERGLSLSGVHENHFDRSDPVRYRDVIHHEYDLWTLRNRTAFQRYIHTGHGFDFNDVPLAGGHGIKRAALAGADIKVEPERFALVTLDGVVERRDAGAQICFTHEKNVQQAITSAAAFFQRQDETARERNTDLDDVSDTFAMGLSDCSGICECENCARVAGAPPYNKDRLVWHFMNRVARGLSERRPGAKIGLFAPYFELKQPPPDVHIASNIVAVACRGMAWSSDPADEPTYPFTREFAGAIDATRDAGAEMRCYDYVMWQGTPQPLNILDAAKAYKQRGIQHYHAEVMSRNEQIWPVLWVLSQVLWDGEQEPRALLKEYCSAYFGPGGAQVLELLEKMDAASRTLPRIGYGGFADTQAILSDALIAYGRQSLETAIGTTSGKEQARLQRFRDTFEMFARTAETYRSYCMALNERTPDAIAASGKAFADYEAFWDARRLRETCSPGVLSKMQSLAKNVIAPRVEPVGRRELDDRARWLTDLFAFDRAPATVPNLFPLPELWKFRIDDKDQGLREGWQAVDRDDSRGWQVISTWNFIEPQGYKEVNGRYWYRLKVEIPAFPPGRRVFMRIGSLDDDGDIYINGQLAYSRKHVNPDDWQSSFAFDATPFLKPGEANVIAIRGYDSFGAGGLWRPCALYTD